MKSWVYRLDALHKSAVYTTSVYLATLYNKHCIALGMLFYNSSQIHTMSAFSYYSDDVIGVNS